MACRRATGTQLLLLNPDCFVRPGALAELQAELQRMGGRGICGPRTVFPNGSVNPTSWFRRPTLWAQFCITFGLTAMFRGSRWFDPETVSLRKAETSFAVDIVTGCCLLADRETWEFLKGFDETFFLYGEEFDLCLRAGLVGIPVRACPIAVVEHEGGHPDRGDANRMVHFLRGRAILSNRYLGRGSRAVGVWLWKAWVVRKLLVANLVRPLGKGRLGKLEMLRLVWRRRGEWGAGSV